MFKIIIHKDKITCNIKDEMNEEWEQVEITESSGPISKYFNDEVSIDDDVTFEDVINIMEKFENDINYCFAAQSQCIPIRLYIKEMRTDIKHDTEISRVELFRKGEIIDAEILLKNSIRGFMSEESAEVTGHDIEDPVSVDTCNVNNLKTSKVALNHNIVIVDYDNDLQDDTEKIIFDGFFTWTLYDFFATIVSVLTQNGTPEERDVIHNTNHGFERSSNNKEDIQMWITLFQEELEEKEKSKELAIDEERFEEVVPIIEAIKEIKEKIRELKEQESKINGNGQVA